MSRYQPYPSYKDSGVEWLGDIPEHWETKKLKYNLGLQTQKMTISRDIVIALENIESKSGKYIATESSYQGEDVAFKSGDILFGKLRPYLAKVYKCDSNGVAFGDLLTYRPTKDFDSSFAFYSLLSDEFIKIVDSSTYGTKMPRASSEFINEMMLATPSYEEQTAIANFLDIQTSKIDTLIAKQERMIELLGEKRSAMISHAVTKGLNPDVAMKESGVEWLGEVPEHWEMTKIGFISEKIGSGKTPKGGSEVYVDEGILFLRSQNIYDEGLRLEEVVYISPEIDEEMQNTRVKEDDILLNVTGASIGRCAQVPKNFQRSNVNQHVCIIRISTKEKIPFVAWLFKSSLVKNQIDAFQNGAGREGLNFEQIANIRIPLPDLLEQQKICAYLVLQASKIDTLIAKACQAIDLMKERRSALISAAVTGKIDVREMA